MTHGLALLIADITRAPHTFIKLNRTYVYTPTTLWAHSSHPLAQTFEPSPFADNEAGDVAWLRENYVPTTPTL